MFNGQFRLYENLMYEKKCAKVNFAESLQWPIYNCLLCNKKDCWILQLTRNRTRCRLGMGVVYRLTEKLSVNRLVN